LVWLVGVAELFRIDFQTILHFADLGGQDSLVRRMRKYLGNKCTNATGAKSTVLPGECQKEFDIRVIVNAYTQHKVGVDVANQYQSHL